MKNEADSLSARLNDLKHGGLSYYKKREGVSCSVAVAKQ
jgi:hypothetical protein